MNWNYHHGSIRIRPSFRADIDHLKFNLRESDCMEIKASHNHSPYDALMFGLKHSAICLTVLFKGIPVAMGGVVPDDNVPGSGAVWLLGTDAIYKIRVSFLKLSKKYMEMCLREYPLLYNFIPPSNLATIRWLVWLGASLDDPQPIGVHGEQFQYFSIGKVKAHV